MCSEVEFLRRARMCLPSPQKKMRSRKPSTRTTLTWIRNILHFPCTGCTKIRALTHGWVVCIKITYCAQTDVGNGWGRRNLNAVDSDAVRLTGAVSGKSIGHAWPLYCNVRTRRRKPLEASDCVRLKLWNKSRKSCRWMRRVENAATNNALLSYETFRPNICPHRSILCRRTVAGCVCR